MCAVSVLGFAAINVIGRALKAIHYTVLCSAQFTLNILLSLLVLLITRDATHELLLLDSFWIAVLLLGASRTFSTQLFVRATQLAKSQRIASLNYTQSLFGYAVDVLLYSYTLSLLEVLAVATILATGYITFNATRRDAQHSNHDDDIE